MEVFRKGDDPILCVDFDGVLHGYESGWTGPRKIVDAPVDGAIEWLTKVVEDGWFRVEIFSSRSRYWGGRRAMKKWLRKWGVSEGVLKMIGFPIFKPSAFVTIDDRAVTFKGKFPEDLDDLKNFSPWNRSAYYPVGLSGMKVLKEEEFYDLMCPMSDDETGKPGQFDDNEDEWVKWFYSKGYRLVDFGQSGMFELGSKGK